MNRLGFRFLYATIPFAFFSLGPIALIIASIVMLIVEMRMDRIGDWRGLICCKSDSCEDESVRTADSPSEHLQ